MCIRDRVYVGQKTKMAAECNIKTKDFKLEASTDQETLLKLIDELNNDSSVHGILVQLPLPNHINSNKVIDRISIEKDVDGFNSKNKFDLRNGSPLDGIIYADTVLNKMGSPYRIEDSLAIAKNAIVNVEPGTVILMGENAKIKVQGGFNLLGENENPIIVKPLIPGSYFHSCLLYTSPSPRDLSTSRMPSSA